MYNFKYDYFAMSDAVNLYEYDGRAFLQADHKTYDVILVDAYQDITIPFQMSSVEFFSMVRDHLSERGIMVVNMNMYSDGEGAINEYLADTILSVFPNVYTADVAWNTNRELFASSNGDCFELLNHSLSSGRYSDELSSQLLTVSSKLVKYEDRGEQCILTDDKAPVEVLGMSMIDGLITDQVGYYKDLLKEEGLKGLIDSLLQS